MEDHNKAWKDLGRSPEGLRKLQMRLFTQRGLESYAIYSLDAAAARLEQLLVTLQNAGVAAPLVEEPSYAARAELMLVALENTGYSDRDVDLFIWSQYGDAGRAVYQAKENERALQRELEWKAKCQAWLKQLNALPGSQKINFVDEWSDKNLIDYFREINGVQQEKGRLEFRDVAPPKWGWWWVAKSEEVQP